MDGTALENVDEYLYLGHIIKLAKENQADEMKRRKGLTWTVFGRLSHILKNKEIPLNLKRKVFDTCILPVATWCFETITMTKRSTEYLRVMRRTMEHIKLEVSP